MSATLAEMPGLNEASERLAQLEASDQGGVAAATQLEQREDGSTARAGAGETETAQTPSSDKTDTPATAVKAGAKPEADGGKSPEQKPGDKTSDDTRSRYARSQERLEKTWDNVNKRKGELDTRQQQLDERERALSQRETDFQAQSQRQASQYKPEDYEAASSQKAERARGLHQQADGIEARAKQAEDDGKYTEAAKLQDEAKRVRKQAYREEGTAEDLKAHAEQLRKNPPADAKAVEAKAEAARKDWTMRAAKDFPELAIKDSALQKTVAAHLNQLQKDDRALASQPAIIYHATRLAVAETAAARVPALEKEIGELKAKVKEFEGLTAPGGTSSAQRLAAGDSPKTDEQEREELGQMAATLGTFR